MLLVLRLLLFARFHYLFPRPEMALGVLAHVEHKIKPRDEPVTGLGHSHYQLAAEQSVAAVHRLVRKIELGGEHALLRRLHLDVVVAGAGGIERRQYGGPAGAALAIGEQKSAIAEGGAVGLAPP